MRNTQKSGQILRSKKRPRPTLRSGRAGWTNSNTSRQIPARVIEADMYYREHMRERSRFGGTFRDGASAVERRDPDGPRLLRPGLSLRLRCHEWSRDLYWRFGFRGQWPC